MADNWRFRRTQGEASGENWAIQDVLVEESTKRKHSFSPMQVSSLGEQKQKKGGELRGRPALKSQGKRGKTS